MQWSDGTALAMKKINYFSSPQQGPLFELAQIARNFHHTMHPIRCHGVNIPLFPVDLKLANVTNSYFTT